MKDCISEIKALYNKMISYLTIMLCMLYTSCRNDHKESGWSTYRHNNMRTAVTSEVLPSSLTLKWLHKSPHAPSPVWDLPAEEMKRTHSDDTYHVSAANGIAYYGSSVDNKVYALDISSGREKWVFYTEGPVRFSPTISNKRLYFGSDDGYVYCLNARTGKQVWKYRPGPKDSKIIGSGRMVSLWPVRTSVLVMDNTVYFGAGVFPYDGLYICALNAKDGSVIWRNDDLDDDVYELRYGGISPQGYLIATESKLFVPSGRAVPAVFDRKNGEFLYYLTPAGKQGGTWGMIDQGQLIAGDDKHGFSAKVSYDAESGKLIGDAFASFAGIDMTATDSISYVITNKGIYAIDRLNYPAVQNKIDSIRNEQKEFLTRFLPQNFDLIKRIPYDSFYEVLKPYDGLSPDNITIDELLNDMVNSLSSLKEKEKILELQTSRWFFPHEKLYSIILTGTQVITGGQDVVAGLDRETGKELWKGKVEGIANGLAVSDKHLLVSTDKGYIYCFSDGEGSSGNKLPVMIHESDPLPYPGSKNSELIAATAEELLRESGVYKGYCLVLDCGEGELLYELAQRSELTIIGIDRDKGKIRKARELLDKTGLYGKRVIAEYWPVTSLPEYFADLVVTGENTRSNRTGYTAEELFRVLRPGGGMVFYGISGKGKGSSEKDFSEELSAEWEPFAVSSGEVITGSSRWITFKRQALAGAGGWTHQYGDPANTSCSDDQLVKAPFSTLWYGSPGPQLIPDRHAKGTSPVTFHGKLIVQGENIIMAYNAYNGTLLWKRELIGSTRVRADVDGGNMAVNHHGLFLALDNECLQLNLETGETINTYSLPSEWKGKQRRWGYIAVKNNILLGSVSTPLKQVFARLSENIFYEHEEWEERDILHPSDAMLYDYYKYRISESIEDVERAFQRDGTEWRFITKFPSGDPGVLGIMGPTDRIMTGDGLFAYNMETNELLWTYNGKKIAHITISLSDDEVYFADIKASHTQRVKALNEKQHNIKNGIWEKFEPDLDFNEADVRLVSSLDILTGKKNWERAVDLSGCGDDFTASGYRNGVLVFFGSYGLHDKWRFPAGQLKWHRITAISAEDGEMLWSRPLNYMVRPLIIGDEIIIEPRKCNLYTGEIITRVNPVTGQEVPWEFFRPGHTCAVSAGNEHCLFYRSYNAAYYDLKEDKGLTYYGAIRPGCWINMVPGNGLVLFPEASSGCTCSFPIRTSVVLKPTDIEEVEEWSLYINNAPLTPVKHLAINFGAPGDRKDKTGTIWFGYPRQYVNFRAYPRSEHNKAGLSFSLNESIQEGMGYYSYDSKGVEMKGTENPWLYTNGCVGLQKCEIPLIDDIFGESPGVYTVRLGFNAPATHRKFDVKLQGEVVLENLDVLKEAGAVNRPVVKEFKRIPVSDDLIFEFVPETADPGADQATVINCIEIIREDEPVEKDQEKEQGKLTSEAALRLLREAGNMRDKGNKTEALQNYHRVFRGSEVKEHKLAALKGMEAIGSVESLPVIKNYCRNLDPIMWNYKEPDKETVDAAINVFKAIAENIAKEDKELGDKMLNYIHSKPQGD